MLLGQASPSDPVSALAVNGLLANSSLARVLQFYQIGGAADNLKKAHTGNQETIFRAINTSNTPTPPTPSYATVTKKIISFDAKVDVVIEDRNQDTMTELAYQTQQEALSASFLLQEKLIEGNAITTPTEINGLRKLVNESYILTSGKVLPLGNSNTIRAAQQEAIESLLQAIEKVRGGAQFGLMNNALKVRLLTIAKELGYYRLSKDELGSEVEMIGDMILLGAGYKEDGTALMPFTETVGEDGATSSIFMFRTGERFDLTCATSAGVVGRYAGQIGNFYINNVNLDMDMVLQNPTGLYQVKGWKLS